MGMVNVDIKEAAAAEFSFFLALPTMGAACAFKLLKDHDQINWSAHWPLMLAGCIASFITALAVVAILMKLIEKKNSLSIWGWYRIVLGAAVLYSAYRV
jgi:undecaprenyl-diphosphatase